MKTLLRPLLVAALALLICAPTLAQRQIVVGQGEGVENWDPPAGWDSASEWIEMNVYDCLVYPDRETGEMIGWLAESWENLGRHHLATEPAARGDVPQWHTVHC